MFEILRNINLPNKKILDKLIDKKKIGYIDFPKLINKFRKLYGTEINLNYKLCAQYVFKIFINNLI